MVELQYDMNDSINSIFSNTEFQIKNLGISPQNDIKFKKVFDFLKLLQITHFKYQMVLGLSYQWWRVQLRVYPSVIN